MDGNGTDTAANAPAAAASVGENNNTLTVAEIRGLIKDVVLLGAPLNLQVSGQCSELRYQGIVCQ